VRTPATWAGMAAHAQAPCAAFARKAARPSGTATEARKITGMFTASASRDTPWNRKAVTGTTAAWMQATGIRYARAAPRRRAAAGTP